MRHTFGSSLALIGVDVPGHLVADVEVPVLTGPQRQGDISVWPQHETPAGLEWSVVPQAGVQVVIGEATGNTHWLHQGIGCTGVQWARVDDGLIIGYLRVPDGESAYLIHTDEHGSNGIGPGAYRVKGKREQADVIRRVQD